MSGEVVVLLRRLKAWSQTELAKRSGISQPTICRIEHGEHVRKEQWLKLATAFRCSLEYLMDRANVDLLKRRLRLRDMEDPLPT